MNDLVVLVLNVLSVVSVLALVALGLAIVFGMMDIVNLAHGEFVTIGAFALALMQRSWGPEAFWPALLVAPVLGALMGLLLEGTVIRFLYHRTLDTLLATYAISLIVQKLLQLGFGKHPQMVFTPVHETLPVFGVQYPSYRLLTIAIAIVVVLACLFVFTRTRFGVELRAVIQNPRMAEASGINTKLMNRVAFAGGAALAALAGVLVAPYASVESHLGELYLGKAFFVIVIGGIGSIVGSLAGSAFIGTVETTLNYHVDPSFASALVLILAIVVIRLRPQGLIPGYSAAHHLLGKG